MTSLRRSSLDYGGVLSLWQLWATVIWCPPLQWEGISLITSKYTYIFTCIPFYQILKFLELCKICCNFIHSPKICHEQVLWKHPFAKWPLNQFILLFRCVGIMCAITGIFITGLPIPIVASNFNHYYKCAKLRTNMEKRNKKSRHSYPMSV